MTAWQDEKFMHFVGMLANVFTDLYLQFNKDGVCVAALTTSRYELQWLTIAV